jgi:hypothetical protein
MHGPKISPIIKTYYHARHGWKLDQKIGFQAKFGKLQNLYLLKF